MSREVSLTLVPTFDLNHCRCSSMSEIRAIGASQIRAANSVRSSNSSSGTVSRTSYCQSTFSRLASLEGVGVLIISLQCRQNVGGAGRCQRKACFFKPAHLLLGAHLKIVAPTQAGSVIAMRGCPKRHKLRSTRRDG